MTNTPDSHTALTREEFLGLSDANKLLVLVDVLRESAERCAKSALTAGTWIEETFDVAADDLYVIAFKMRVYELVKEKGSKLALQNGS